MGLVIVYSVKLTKKISNTYFSAVPFLPVYSLSLKKNSAALSLFIALFILTWTVGSLVL